MQFGLSSNQLYTSSLNGNIVVYDLNKNTAGAIRAHENMCTAIRVLDEDRLLVSVGYDEKLCLHDLRTKKTVVNTQLNSPLTCLDVLGNDYVFTGSYFGLL